MNRKLIFRAKGYLNRGFLSLEYAFLIAVVVVALIALSVYLRRALCGKWRDAGDTFGYGRQYDQGATRVTP